MFSKACEYAIRATLFITAESIEGRRTGLKAIAKQSDSPEAFIAKVLQQLVKSNIIKSAKGPNGGFEIEPKSLNTINLSQIVKAIDGDSIYTGCGLGLHLCDAMNPCPVHDQFKIIREGLKEMLEGTLITDLAAKLNAGESTINNQFINQ
jgi:Rrf2 family iron-sulfur cluster assembly transcriptional regulator